MGAPPEGCGANYLHLVQAAGGLTKQFPHGEMAPGTGIPSLWCSEPQAQAWAAQAKHIFGLVRAAWDALMAAENKARDWTQTTAVRASVTAYEKDYADLPAPSFWMAFGLGGCADAVARMIANIENGACQLDLLNRALQNVGAGVVPGPFAPPPGTGFFDVQGIGLLVLAALAFWAFSQRGGR